MATRMNEVLMMVAILIDGGCNICFGVQSIKHANALSEKINFSALGGSKVAIFGGDELDPIYFEVHMFLNPPGPPYMSRNAQMCYF